MNLPSKFSYDWIDAVFRVVVGFFVGLLFGSVAKSAELSGWVSALGLGVAVCLVFGLVLLVMNWIDLGFDKVFNLIGWGNGIKPAPTKSKPHWFVRFGWMFGLALGVLAYFYLPEGVLAWLL